MKTPPFAAALTAVLITLAGGPMGLGDAHARAIYTGTFDPQDNQYQWNGTHTFTLSEACLSSNGWRQANTGSGGYIYSLKTEGGSDPNGIQIGYSDEVCDVELVGGSLTITRLENDPEDNITRTLNFPSTLTSLIWGVYIEGGKLAGIDSMLTGPLRFNATDEDLLFGNRYTETDGSLYLRWESGQAPLQFVPEDLFANVSGSTGNTYVQNLDPVYLYLNNGQSGKGQELTPGKAAMDVTFRVTDRIPGVPEPGSLALVGVALAALGAGLKRRRKA